MSEVPDLDELLSYVMTECLPRMKLRSRFKTEMDILSLVMAFAADIPEEKIASFSQSEYDLWMEDVENLAKAQTLVLGRLFPKPTQKRKASDGEAPAAKKQKTKPSVVTTGKNTKPPSKDQEEQSASDSESSGASSASSSADSDASDSPSTPPPKPKHKPTKQSKDAGSKGKGKANGETPKDGAGKKTKKSPKKGKRD